MKPNLAILFCAYVISWCVMAVGYSATASVGYHMSPDKAYILLPLIMQVFGATLIAVPASKLMIAIGRRNSFIVGSALGMIGGVLCIYSLYIRNFWLLSFSTLFLGMFNGFGEFIKYAAAELFDDEKKKNRAISIIVSGGIVAAFLGPAIASFSNEYFELIGPYVGPYIMVAVLCGLSFGLFLFYTNKPTHEQDSSEEVNGEEAPSTGVKYLILTNPVFILGTSMGVLAFLIMGIMMDAFPITMIDHGMHFGDTTTVLQWHMLAMFAPSYLTSMFLTRFNFTPTAVVGVLMNLIGILFAIQGKEFINFLGSLFFIGLGWNFMYIAGTSMIANMGRFDRKNAEGYNNFFVTATYAIAAPLAAFIVVKYGWDVLSYFSLALVAIAASFVFRYRRISTKVEAMGST